MATNAASIPAESWRKPVNIGEISCGFWEMGKRRITPRFHGFAPKDVLKRWRICFTSMSRIWKKQGEADHKSVFVDGTKLESRAGRYTFAWRGTAEKNLEKVKQAVLEEAGCANS